MPIGHKVIYTKPQPPGIPGVEHNRITHLNSGNFNAIYCDYFSTGCTMTNRNTFPPLNAPNDPIRVARLGNYYYSSW